MGLKGDTLDMVIHMPSTMAAEVEKDFTVLEDTMKLVQAVYLNHQAEPFNNETVRQALCHAINRQQIMDFVAGGRGTAVGSSMYPAFTKYFMPELVDYYPYDPAKAKDLLAKAGYPNGFEMSITVASNNKPHVDTAEVVAEQLRAVGITVKVDLVDWQTWYDDAYKARKFQTTVVGLDASYMTARAMLERFTSTSSKNFTNYNNPAYDELFRQAVSATDEAQQTAIYKDMQKMLTETAANLYIQDLCDLVVMRHEMKGLNFYPTFVMDLSTVQWVKE
jgi:peptide/nickel transport system substrate-binding protein